MPNDVTDVSFKWRNFSLLNRREYVPGAECSKSDPELVSFILDEVDRFSRMTFEDCCAVSKPPDWPLIYELPLRGRQFTCGKLASDAIAELSRRLLASDDVLRDRISLDWVYQVFKRYFLKAVLRSARDGVIDEVIFAERYRQAVTRALHRRACNRRFGIPCVLPVGSKKDQSFDVGDVQFVSAEHWLQRLESSGEKGPSEWFRNGLRTLPWIAFVSIKRTDDKQGLILAETAVDAAINIVRIFLVLSENWPEASRLGHGGGRMSPQELFVLELEEGKPKELISRNVHPYVGDDFVEFMKAHDDWLQTLSGVVNTITRGEQSSGLASRFMDALKWFGEASLEDNDGSAIVKSVMSLERLLIFPNDGNEGLKSRVSKRAAAISARFFDVDYIKVREDAKLAYTVRSDLMHGALGPFQGGHALSPYRVLSLVAQTLLAFANLVMSLRISDKTDQGARSAMVKMVEQMERQTDAR